MFYRKLYASPKLIKKRRKLVRKIKHGKIVPNLYVITLSSGNDLMEFYHSFQLKQPYFKDELPFIIGIADGYEEALELVQKILSDTFEKTGTYNVRDFCLGVS